MHRCGCVLMCYWSWPSLNHCRTYTSVAVHTHTSTDLFYSAVWDRGSRDWMGHGRQHNSLLSRSQPSMFNRGVVFPPHSVFSLRLPAGVYPIWAPFMVVEIKYMAFVICTTATLPSRSRYTFIHHWTFGWNWSNLRLWNMHWKIMKMI